MADIKIIGELTQQSYTEFSDTFDECIETCQAAQEAGVWDEDPITIELNSEGGDVFSALAICSKIRLSGVPVHITALGTIASAAVLILASGTSRSMAKEAWVMVHEDEVEYSGRVSKLERTAKHQRRMEDQWNMLLAERTRTSAETWAELHKCSTHLSPEECLALGLIDEIT